MYNRICIIVLITSTGVNAWGREGHLIASHIATSLLSKGGETLVSDLLVKPGEDLSQKMYEASIWPDMVTHIPDYEWTKPLHFINIPHRVCDGFQYHRDCGAQGYMCTVSAIGNYSSRVADVTLPQPERAEALKFLIHFLTDVTQPLHIGFAADKGGNDITVTPPWDHPFNKAGKAIPYPKSRPLHVVWDSHILQYMLAGEKKTWDQWAEEQAISILATNPVTDPITDDPLTYATNTASATATLSCGKAYQENGKWIPNHRKLGIKYYQEGSEVVKNQLIKAGVDVARFINQIADDLGVGPAPDEMSTDSGSDYNGMTDDEDFPEWENAFASPDYEDEFHMFGP